MKKKIPAELLLIGGLLLNSFALDLMVKSALGVATLSSVPLVFATIFPKLTIGTWTGLVQVLYIIVMMAYTKRFKVGYVLSFLLAIVFSLFVDMWNVLLVQHLPSNIILNLLYFGAGLLMISFGAVCMIRCKLPILAFDLVIRELSDYTGKGVKVIKTGLDIVSVIVSVVLSYLVLGRLVGIGVGTIFNMFVMGSIMGFFGDYFDANYEAQPITPVGNWLAQYS